MLRATGEPGWVDLGRADAAQDATNAFRAALANRVKPTSRMRERAADLFARLIAPLEPHLAGVRMLLIAPDGVLNLVPFGALTDSERRYLVERYELDYPTSGRDLLRLAAGAGQATAPLVLAAPDYDAETILAPASSEATPSPRRSRELGGLRFDPLPETRKEAASIARTLDVKPLVGPKATERALREHRAPRVLHIATHGYFLVDQPEKRPSEPGHRLLASRSGVGPFAAPPPITENPLLRSGLALAGANTRSTGGDDGILSALEMIGLDLWGTKLVVLSACETAVGQASVGEGVYGMRRALVSAGAESKLASLWKVDDTATRELMENYYARLVAGEGRSAALRAVQLEMLERPERAHPCF